VTPRTQTAPRRRLSAEDRRAAILRAALDVFAERGFAGASLDDVASRDGVSKTLIYEHFASKRELQRALLETYVHEALDRIAAAAAAAEPGEARLRAGLEAFLGFVEERPAAWRLISRNTDDPDAAEAMARLQDEAAAGIAAMMAEDAPPPVAGEDREQAIEMLARLLSGAFQSLADWWTDRPEVPRKRVVAVAMDFAWLGFDRLSTGERWRPG
jgi:AcrR family transcriptional regulator